MATITKTLKIPAPLADVWARARAPERVHELFGMLSSAELDGDRRVCRTPDGQRLEEIILSVDDDLKRVAYSVVLSPFGFEHHAASWQFVEAGQSTVMHWVSDFKPDALKKPLEEVIDRELENISRGLSASS